MRLYGRIYKEGKWWLAEVPLLDAMTQGHSWKPLAMVADLLETLANRPGFCVHVHAGQQEAFEVSATDTRRLLSLLLRRQRERSGLSLAEAAVLLGAKSRNAYARYERGTSVPTLDKLTELLQAVAPGQDVVLQQSVEAVHLSLPPRTAPPNHGSTRPPKASARASLPLSPAAQALALVRQAQLGASCRVQVPAE